jgi:hypothetical protein
MSREPMLDRFPPRGCDAMSTRAVRGAPADRLLSGAEAAALLNISESSFWRLVNAGRIPKVDLSGTGKAGRGRKLWQFRESALWAYIEANTRLERPEGQAGTPQPPPVSGREALVAAGWDGDAHDVRPRRARDAAR